MTDVAIYRPGELATLPAPSGPLDDWITVADQVVRLSEVISQSPFVPDGLRGSVPATAAAILTGRELGIPPMTSLANIHVIHGKPGLSALVMRALILSKGHEWQDVEVTDTRARVRGRRRGETDWTEAIFTADQARQAHIQLGGYPQDKLYARATSRLARRKFADVIAGMPYSAEELEDGGVEDGERPAPPAESNGHAGPAKPAARTAQRRTRAGAPPAAPESPPRETGAPAPAQAAPAGLPPLPGEDDPPTSGAGATSATAPASGEPSSAPSTDDRATPGQVGLIVQHFERLGVDDRDVRLGFAAQIAGRDSLASTKDLTPDEAKAVLGTLARCKDAERLIVLLDEQEQAATAHAGAEGSQDGPSDGG